MDKSITGFGSRVSYFQFCSLIDVFMNKAWFFLHLSFSLHILEISFRQNCPVCNANFELILFVNNVWCIWLFKYVSPSLNESNMKWFFLLYPCWLNQISLRKTILTRHVLKTCIFILRFKYLSLSIRYSWVV